MEGHPESLHSWIWWLPAAVLLVLMTAPVGVSPDGVEMAAAGACLWRTPIDAGACVGLEPWFWPPLFVLMAGLPTVLGLDPGLAAPWVSAVCMALLSLPVAILASRLGGYATASFQRRSSSSRRESGEARNSTAGLLAGILLLATPAMRVHAWTGDARSLFLLCLLGAAVLASGSRSRRRAATLGLLLGAACLTRPEGLLYAGVLLVVATVRWSRVSAAAWGVLGAVVVPYWAVLSMVAGRPVLSSRGWQSAAYGWLQVLPEASVKNELAAGSWGTPLRRVLSTSEVAASVPATLDPSRALSWFAFVVVESVPIWLGLLSVVGLVVMIRQRRWNALMGPGAVALPALVVMLIPQAQDPLLPANNALPLLVALVVLSAVGISGLAQPLPARWRSAAMGVMASGALALGLMDRGLAPPPDPPSAVAAAAWLQDAVGPTHEVGASLVSAPIVLRARLPRRAVPAPWSQGRWRTTPPDYLVVSHADLPALSPLLHDLSTRDQLDLAAVLGTDDWVRIYRVRPSAD